MKKRVEIREFLRDSSDSVFYDKYVGYHWNNLTESALMHIGTKLQINLNFVI